MNKKKILILTFLFVAVTGFTLAPASAAKTGKLYFKKHWSSPVTTFDKNIPNNDYIHGEYYLKAGQGPKNYMAVGLLDKVGYNTKINHKITKISVKFKKTVKGKNYYTTKTFYRNGVGYYPKNGYKPYYAVVTYTKKSISSTSTGSSSSSSGGRV